MSDPYLGEIRPISFMYAPRKWALCNGQLLEISQHTALYTLLWDVYGGDGQTTFALPDLRGRAPLGVGSGPRLQPYQRGYMAGVEFVPLDIARMPQHSHTHSSNYTASLKATDDQASIHLPDENNYLARSYSTYGTGHNAENYKVNPDSANVNIGGIQADFSTTLSNTGSSQAHNNMQPSLVMNYIISLDGLYPPRP